MIQFQLWAFTPGSDTPTILPQPLTWQASFVLSDLGGLSITYPLSAPGHEILDGYCDIEVRYWDGTAWVCPPQGRFSVIDRNVDPVGERTQPTRTYSLQPYGWVLRRIVQEQTTGLDDSGNRAFPGSSTGQVVGILINEAQAAGSVPDLTYQNSAGTGGSPAYPVGKAVLDILAEARDEGLVEWLMQPDTAGQGRKLVAYSSVGTDRSTGTTPVILREGVDVVAAPSKVSIQDLAGRAVVVGDAGHYLSITNPGADIPYGLLADVVQAGGLTDAAALEIAAQARLDKGAGPRAQHTRQVIFDKATFVPFVDYGLGDTILGPDESGALASLRVRQITITLDTQKGLGGNLVLGDRFTERDERMARLLRQLTGGAGSMSGGGRKPTTTSDDARKPSAPTGFNVGSTPFTDPYGKYKALASFGWVNPTTATDGSDMDPASVQVYGRKGTSGTFGRVTSVDFPATDAQVSPFDAGVTWQFKARATSGNAKIGPFSDVVEHTMAEDTTAPPAPGLPTFGTERGIGKLSWDGLDEDGDPQPADYSKTEVHVDDNTGFTPSASTLVGYLHGADSLPLPDLPYNVNRYVKLVSLDRAGNRSDPSHYFTVMVHPLYDTDFIGQIVSGANIVDGTIDAADKVIANSVTTLQLAAGAITADKIGANAITAAKMQVGALDAFVITGATIQTAASGSRITLNGTYIDWSDSDGDSLFRINASSEAFYLRSATTGARFVLDQTGLKLYNSGGSQTVYLKNDGSATFTGPVVTGGTITGAVIRTSAGDPQVNMTSSQLRMTDAAGNSLVLFEPSSGRVYLDSGSASYPRLIIDSSGGLTWYKASGNVTFRLNVADGSATFAGDITSGATITGATIQTSAATNPRIVFNASSFRLYDASGNNLISFSADSGNFFIRSALSGARFAMDQNGLRLYNSGGTNTVDLNSSGDATFTGTVTASAINTSTINGATVTGTNSVSGTLSGGTYSGGTYGGTSLVTGGMYASGSGKLSSANASNRVDVYGTVIDFVVGGSSSNGGTITGTSGVGIDIIANVKLEGAVTAPLVYSTTTGTSANVVVGAAGVLQRSTSSIRGKADVQPIDSPERILAARGVTFYDRSGQHQRRLAGFTAEDIAATGVDELYGVDAQGWPESVNYDRLSAYHHELIRDLREQVSRLSARLDELVAA